MIKTDYYLIKKNIYQIYFSYINNIKFNKFIKNNIKNQL